MMSFSLGDELPIISLPRTLIAKYHIAGQNGHLVDGGKREVVGRGQVSTVARDVHLASAPKLLQHRLERRVQETRVEAVPRKQQSIYAFMHLQSILLVAFFLMVPRRSLERLPSRVTA